MNRIGRSVGGQRFGPCGRNPGRHDATPRSASLRGGEGCEVCEVKCVELLTAIMPADNSSVDYLSSAGIISTSRSGGGSRQIPLPVCCGKGTFLVRKNKRLFGWGKLPQNAFANRICLVNYHPHNQPNIITHANKSKKP